MKISFVTTMAGDAWGGSEELWAELAILASKNNNVFVSIYDWGTLPNKMSGLEKNGIVIDRRKRISYSSFTGKIKGKINQVLFAKKELVDFIAKSNPDHVVISMGGFSDLEINPLRDFLLMLDIPYSLIVHANPETRKIDKKKRALVKEVCLQAENVYFVSKRLQQIAERQIAYAFPNARIVANPVNMKETGVLPWRDSDTMEMALVGRLDVSIKGQALLLQILSQDKWRERPFRLNLYGEGPDKDIIEELIAFYGLEDKVFLHGHVNDIRQDIWTTNHILLMPSYYEGLPLALVEAMMSGRTAVATDVGGNAELITDEIDGFIAEGATYFSFDKALEHAWDKQEEWNKMGQNAFVKANKYFEKYDYKTVFSKVIRNEEY
ncbi:glycosyltransferase [Sulfurovum sp.]|uniref:glycosyltransferase n=1 Tax=Sulfurovum sp. TaxID=1969726 RepID=UPI00356AF586